MSLTSLRTRSECLAFTLLEMLAATVIAALLFVALTSLLRSFTDQRRVAQRISARQPQTQLLAEQLRYDLVNAQFVQQELAGLRLMGPTARDWTTRRPTGRRAEITYRVARIGNESWLLRREVHLDEASTQRTREELVWSGVADINLVFDSTSVEDEAQGPSPAAVAGMRPAPSRMAVIVRRTDGGQLLNLRIRHHWEDF